MIRLAALPLAFVLCDVVRADDRVAMPPVRMSSDSGFDRAVNSAVPRVVKLYGLGAGLEQGYGSGILISHDGLVATVLSLLIDARAIRAVTSDGTLYQAAVVFRDEKRQLALLQLSAATPDAAQGQAFGSGENAKLTQLPHFGLDCRDLGVLLSPCTTRLSPGDWVIAAGNAFKVADGAETVSIAHGVFSTRTRLDARRRKRDFAYTGDVLVIDGIVSNPGAPGGAIVNLDGQLVGMIGREVISNLTHTHLNYGIPVDVLKETVDEFQRNRTAGGLVEAIPSTPPGDPGTETGPVTAKRSLDFGIRLSKTGYQSVLPYVDRVLRDSSAAKLGVRKDDLILSVGSHSVSSVDEYESRVRSVRPGEDVVLVIRRGREILSFRFLTQDADVKP